VYTKGFRNDLTLSIQRDIKKSWETNLGFISSFYTW